MTPLECKQKGGETVHINPDHVLSFRKAGLMEDDGTIVKVTTGETLLVLHHVDDLAFAIYRDMIEVPNRSNLRAKSA